MDTKVLLSGLIGFFIGGLLVSVVAVTNTPTKSPHEKMSMSEMTESLKGKQGDDYDKAFIAHMITHHEGAIEMAQLSSRNAKHDEIKLLSNDIIKAQTSEINQLKAWELEWQYSDTDPTKGEGGHSSH